MNFQVHTFIIFDYIAKKTDFVYFPYTAITPLFFIQFSKFSVVSCILSIRPDIFFHFEVQRLRLKMVPGFHPFCQKFTEISIPPDFSLNYT